MKHRQKQKIELIFEMLFVGFIVFFALAVIIHTILNKL